ncbi:MAG: trypsin-like peptidase domain-containing protein [bacterium]|nr:trypsin-like peptidase domain-containing protein [bacterium]
MSIHNRVACFRNGSRAARLFLAYFLMVPVCGAMAQEAATLEKPAVESELQAIDEPESQERLASARDLSMAFNLAAEKAMPSVVKILSRSKRAGEEDSILSIIGGRDEQVFDSVGSGVIISSDGLILTNHHVVQDAARIEVRLTDGRRYKVEETKSDPKSDVAIIKIDADEELPVADLGTANDLYVGEWVLAIGSPFMLDSSVSAGIISGTRRYRDLSRTVSGQFLQTDAAINPGNSGGPLIDLDGKVVGINTAISTRTGSFQGIGFAIPIERASWILDELMNYGKVRRAYVGVRTKDVDYNDIRTLDLPRTGGALVVDVVAFYPGSKAGLDSGDVIIEFDGQVVETAADFAGLVQQSPIGQPLTLVVIREGERTELSIELVERPQ